jgi:formylglycine-generating enzyme required for sulfatase activity
MDLAMVEIGEGWFWMGWDHGLPGERPRHRVWTDAFAVARFPVTNREYARFLEDTSAAPPPWWTDPRFGEPEQPVVGTSWFEAVAYCDWLSATTAARHRLPTEAEWEKAARGTDGRLFPWGEGDEFDCDRANTDQCGDVVLPVGTASDGASPYGALDMAGNVWEWTQDYYAADTYESHDGPDPQGPAEGESRVYRGGSYGNLPTLARVTNRADTYNPAVGGAGLGFRCAAD